MRAYRLADWTKVRTLRIPLVGMAILVLLAACNRPEDPNLARETWDDNYAESIESLSTGDGRPAEPALKRSVARGLCLASEDDGCRGARIRLKSRISEATSAVHLEYVAPGAGIVRYLSILEIRGRAEVEDNLEGQPRTWELDALQWIPIRNGLARRMARPLRSVAEISANHPEVFYVSIRIGGRSGQFVRFGPMESSVGTEPLRFDVDELTPERALVGHLWNVARWAPSRLSSK